VPSRFVVVVSNVIALTDSRAAWSARPLTTRRLAPLMVSAILIVRPVTIASGYVVIAVINVVRAPLTPGLAFTPGLALMAMLSLMIAQPLGSGQAFMFKVALIFSFALTFAFTGPPNILRLSGSKIALSSAAFSPTLSQTPRLSLTLTLSLASLLFTQNGQLLRVQTNPVFGLAVLSLVIAHLA